MELRAVAVLWLALCAVDCGRGAAPQSSPGAAASTSGDLGTQAGNVAADTQTLRAGQDAANAVVRNATDCEAAKAGMTEANRKLDEAAGQLKTAAARLTLDNLRQQLRHIAEACP